MNNTAIFCTTLEQIKAHNPCETSYKKLLKGLNKTKADSEPLEFRSIYNILDVEDVIWATRVLDKKTRVHVGALFADTIKHLTEDKRVHNCIEVCFRYARGEATEEELKNASYATDDAATATAAAYATYAASAIQGYVPGGTSASAPYGLGTTNSEGFREGCYNVYVFDSSATVCLGQTTVSLTDPPPTLPAIINGAKGAANPPVATTAAAANAAPIKPPTFLP